MGTDINSLALPALETEQPRLRLLGPDKHVTRQGASFLKTPERAGGGSVHSQSVCGSKR